MPTRISIGQFSRSHGLVAIGGTLASDWLLDAYRHGIFPWPIIRGCRDVQWWSPNPRAVFELDRFHVSRRLGRTCRGGRFAVTSDRDFAGVIRGCATAGGRARATWLSADMISAYTRLFELGHAHSVEVWLGQRLVGGTYGVAIGGLFSGESMFHHERDASKVALAFLVPHLKQRGYQLFDIQELTPHTASLSARIEEFPGEYLRADWLRQSTAMSRLRERLRLLEHTRQAHERGRSASDRPPNTALAENAGTHQHM